MKINTFQNAMITEYNILTLKNMDVEQFTQKELNLSYPSTSKERINKFTSEGYIACALPTLLPTEMVISVGLTWNQEKFR